MELLKLIESSNTSSISSLIRSLSSYLGYKLTVLFKKEEYKNSKESGIGSRYLLPNNDCIRFNWNSESDFGNALKIKSIDIFTPSSNSPAFTIVSKKVPFISAIPTLVKIIKAPKVGTTSIVGAPSVVKEDALINESINMPASKILTDLMIRFKKGEIISKQMFIDDYHALNSAIFDEVISANKTKFEKSKGGYYLKNQDDAKTILTKMLGENGELIVSTGGKKETYTDPVPTISEKISFADTLEHLEGLVKGIASGAFNGLFVVGKGGTGKTQTVEHALSEAGLKEGDGYIRNTGSASASGIYTLLYHNRHSIILFDDSDTALADQESRNIIKAASDTRKTRKISWTKKSSFVYTPTQENLEYYADELNMAPSSFNFFGKIIFISNLSLDKLDPDGSLRTRAFIITVDPTDKEILDHMETILMDIKLENGRTMDKKQREHVLDVVKSSTRPGALSLRKLVRALNLAASGAEDWITLVKLYS